MKKLALSTALVTLCVFSIPVMAGPTYSFNRITANADVDIASQFTVEFTDTALGVSFTFRNAGPYGIIHEIYFDDEILLTEPIISSSSGVAFLNNSVRTVTPHNLPGGSALSTPFVATALFSVGVEQNGHDGVGSGDWLTLDFALQGGLGLDDVVAALDFERDIEGSLSIGMHVHSILDADFSDAFVSNGPVTIPAPGAIFLSSIGVGFVGWLRKRKKL